MVSFEKNESLLGKGCPHSLPLHGESGVDLHVLGAPKINPELGRIIFKPNNNKCKFIRYNFLNIYCHLLISLVWRINTLGNAESPSCIHCFNLVERDEDIKKGEKFTKTPCIESKNRIPGLDTQAAMKSTGDANLAPLSLMEPTSLQYGNTSIPSLSTDHPDWAAGRCLIKQTGVYRVKLSVSTQQVTIIQCYWMFYI